MGVEIKVARSRGGALTAYDAQIIGTDLAVHKQLDGDMWVVAHLPTGAALTYEITENDALAVAKEITESHREALALLRGCAFGKMPSATITKRAAVRHLKAALAQGMAARSDETHQAAQPAGQQPGGEAMRPNTGTPQSDERIGK